MSSSAGGFAGKAFVVRVDESATASGDSTVFADLRFLCESGIRPIVIAPDPHCAAQLVRAINRSGNTAVGLTGADAAMLPGSAGTMGNVQPEILQTLTTAGYIPVIAPTAFDVFGADIALDANDVARAVAAAMDAVRAIFFHALGGVPDPRTARTIDELTPAEALAIADDANVPEDLRSSIRAAALGVRSGVGAAQILDGGVANALVVELLTAHHLGTCVSGSVYLAA